MQLTYVLGLLPKPRLHQLSPNRNNCRSLLRPITCQRWAREAAQFADLL